MYRLDLAAAARRPAGARTVELTLVLAGRGRLLLWLVVFPWASLHLPRRPGRDRLTRPAAAGCATPRCRRVAAAASSWTGRRGWSCRRRAGASAGGLVRRRPRATSMVIVRPGWASSRRLGLMANTVPGVEPVGAVPVTG